MPERPMTDALAGLRTSLARSFSNLLTEPMAWSGHEEMARQRASVQRDHGGASITADGRSIEAAVEEFSRTGQIGKFRDLKYVCLGIGALDGEGWSVLADEKLRGVVARAAEQQPREHRRLRCFQAMLMAYFGFPVSGEEASEESKTGWKGMRNWLRIERERLENLPVFKPPWFETLSRHAEVLTAQPCDRYGDDLLRGDSSSLKEVIEGLSIPQNSWLPEEAIMSLLRAVTGLRDDLFKSKMPDALSATMGRNGEPVSENLKKRGVALLVSRYARCADRPEHPALRDAATAVIGNPWLRRANWDASVRHGGQPDNIAREMVFGWLKGRLVADFFELLSADGAGDSRRLDYWLRYVPMIEDMWFALGSDAQYRRGEAFNDFRNRAKGRLLDLEQTTADNNAFVMRMGRYLLVEFGAKGNAMFVFEWDKLSKPLFDTLTSGRARAGVSIHLLKDEANLDRHVHRDSGGQTWEEKIDAYLAPRLGKRPGEAPRRVGQARRANAAAPNTPPSAASRVQQMPFSETTWGMFTSRNRLRVEDNRRRQGALWVLGVEHPESVIEQLQGWGFKRRDPRGWFKE